MKNLRNTKTLTLAAMLVAIGIVLGFLKIPINQLIELRFGSLPVAMAGNLLGPGVAAIVGALTDIGQYLVKPTGPFFPGFTISGIISGILFGLVLYKKKPTFPRLFMAHTLNTLVVGVVINSYWLNLLYLKNGYLAAIVARLPKELIMIPVLALLQFTIVKVFEKGRIGVLS
ncbi:MAG: folate family ECF transporter S component [Pseudobutyrivibrio sp.]|nr:folate family ECF transporter S component [Pseudobutyrivibrio sp.]